MEEGDGGRKGGVVIIDYVGEVSHGFVALVDTRGEDVCRLRGWINGVDCSLPTDQMSA